MSRSSARWVTLVAMIAGTATVFAQPYPTQTIRLISSGVGGGADIIARLIAQGISGPLGQQVIVENRGGGGGVIPGQMLAKAPPDGHTLLFYASTIWVAPLMQDPRPYDPLRDFASITLAASSPTLVVVNPSLPVRSIKELIALAKARPGELNYGTAGTGSLTHLAGEQFNAMAGVNIVRVNYRGAAAAFNEVLAGQIHLTYANPTLVMPLLGSGRLRTLAVTGAQRSAMFPNVPTVAESGVPGYETEATFGMFAPANTPDAIIARLNQEVVRLLKSAETVTRLLKMGVEVIGSSPEALTAAIKSDEARMGKIIRDAGISIIVK